jgi:hypothetical protein
VVVLSVRARREWELAAEPSRAVRQVVVRFAYPSRRAWPGNPHNPGILPNRDDELKVDSSQDREAACPRPGQAGSVSYFFFGSGSLVTMPGLAFQAFTVLPSLTFHTATEPS